MWRKKLRTGVVLFLGLVAYYFWAKPKVEKWITEPAARSATKLQTTQPAAPPTSVPSQTPTRQSARPTTTRQYPTDDGSKWGVAEQIGEHTWTMKVGMDEQMATPTEIVQALNAYRAKFGSQPLTWDAKLGQYAQTRADYFASINGTDEHAGFKQYLDEANGFAELGFTWIGENSSFGYQLLGVHLVE